MATIDLLGRNTTTVGGPGSKGLNISEPIEPDTQYPGSLSCIWMEIDLVDGYNISFRKT